MAESKSIGTVNGVRKLTPDEVEELRRSGKEKLAVAKRAFLNSD